ncbi:hypothetical protein BOSEA31B_14948 [Hyphomicrobiales bacterium]|nr:hypothetical protein BOSEA31B_14948 [Hyphomicrobiales bacterium]CAH1701435.1 hypothetical protein BOSEA1005_21134 [Hyphomicrobiales bacterium]CAI0345393.1 hypothetical protein BO1005MUT1_390065 [Hyphomicrobiales bacterium]
MPLRLRAGPGRHAGRHVGWCRLSLRQWRADPLAWLRQPARRHPGLARGRRRFAQALAAGLRHGRGRQAVPGCRRRAARCGGGRAAAWRALSGRAAGQRLPACGTRPSPRPGGRLRHSADLIGEAEMGGSYDKASQHEPSRDTPASELIVRLRRVLRPEGLDCACRETLDGALDRFDQLERRREARRRLTDARDHKIRIEALLSFLTDLDTLTEAETDRSVFEEMALLFVEITRSADARPVDPFKPPAICVSATCRQLAPPSVAVQRETDASAAVMEKTDVPDHSCRRADGAGGRRRECRRSRGEDAQQGCRRRHGVRARAGEDRAGRYREVRADRQEPQRGEHSRDAAGRGRAVCRQDERAGRRHLQGSRCLRHSVQAALRHGHGRDGRGRRADQHRRRQHRRRQGPR